MRLAEGRILGVLIAIALWPALTLAQEPIDLGTLPGYTVGRARGINQRGDVVGQAAGGVNSDTGQANSDTGVLWRKRGHGRYSPIALPPLPGYPSSDAVDFAGNRVPVGYSFVAIPGASRYRAVLWRREPGGGGYVPVDLAPPGDFTDARAYSGSLQGLVVGEAIGPKPAAGPPAQHAVSWRLGRSGVESCDLGVPEGFDRSTAWDVNDAGDVVGTAWRMETDEAGQPRQRQEVVVWLRPHRRDGRCTPRPFVLGGRDDLPYKQTPSINDRGDVVARASLLAGNVTVTTRPIGWARCGWRYRMPFEMPVPEGFTDATARDINARREIVGTALVLENGALLSAQPVSWRWDGGEWRTKLLPTPTGSTSTSAEQISGSGAIVGVTPTPAPGGSGALLWLPPHHCWDEQDDGCWNDRHD